MPDLDERQGLLEHLREHGVHATFHYQPLHQAPAGLRYGRVARDGCPVTERVADRLIRLPLFASMTQDGVEQVVTAGPADRVRGGGRARKGTEQGPSPPEPPPGPPPPRP